MSKEDQVMNYLHTNIFDPILNSEAASNTLKNGVRYTIMRMRQRDAKGMVQFYWSAIIGTERSTSFAKKMRQEGSRDLRRLLMNLESDLIIAG